MNHPTRPCQAATEATTPEQALRAACARLGLDGAHAELIRLAENAIYRLPGHLVARVSRPGQLPTARREVTASTWLQQRGFPVVRARTDLAQPVEIGGRAVTFSRVPQITDLLQGHRGPRPWHGWHPVP